MGNEMQRIRLRRRELEEEFSDLLQKQAHDRHVLQRQNDGVVGELARHDSGDGADDTVVVDGLGDEDVDDCNVLSADFSSPNSLWYQYAAVEAEAIALKAEEEKLQSGYVKLKAALVVVAKNIPK